MRSYFTVAWLGREEGLELEFGEAVAIAILQVVAVDLSTETPTPTSAGCGCGCDCDCCCAIPSCFSSRDARSFSGRGCLRIRSPTCGRLIGSRVCHSLCFRRLPVCVKPIP